MGRIICFDIETTGFDYTRGDRCIEIGAVEIVDGKLTENTFHEYINPEGKIIPHETYMVHKISNEFLADKPKMSVIAPKFIEFIADSPVVAHNGIDFDFPFMNHELAMLNMPPIPRNQQLDSLIMARNRVFGPKNYTLDALATWYNIPLTARANAHGALIDSEILAKVYLELEKIEPFPTVDQVIEKQHQDFLKTPKAGVNFPYRSFPITEEEEQIHQDFMQKITK